MLFLASLAVITFEREAAAEPRSESINDEARSHFAEGSRLYDAKDYDQAISHFEKSYALSSAPALLLNIAQAYRLKGDCEKAALFYKRYLEKQPGSPRRAEIEARRSEMQACVDDKAQRPTPTPESPTPPPEPARPATTSPEPPPAATPIESKPSEVDPWRVVAWSGVGLAAVGLAVTAPTLIMALDRQSTLDGTCDASGGCPASERERIDSYNTLRTVSVASGIVTGIGAGAAILGFTLARGHSSSSSAHAAARLWVGPSELGVSGAF